VSLAATAVTSIPYYLEIRPNLRPPGAPGNGGAATGAGGDDQRRGGLGGGFGGGNRGEGGLGGPGGPGGGGPPEGPGGGPPPEGGGQGQPNPPTQAQRDAFRNSPAFKAFRGFTVCTYVTVLSSTEAKAKGIDTASRLPRLLYLPTVGFVFVRPPELPAGGGSLKAAQ